MNPLPNGLERANPVDTGRIYRMFEVLQDEQAHKDVDGNGLPDSKGGR
jgi:hypothetical protein